LTIKTALLSGGWAPAGLPLKDASRFLRRDRNRLAAMTSGRLPFWAGSWMLEKNRFQTSFER